MTIQDAGWIRPALPPLLALPPWRFFSARRSAQL
jgi:hypothetical protein